ncbi:MAG: uroporphyrinogen decarboxylase family protein [Candidatus Latescibacteria bacterium]|jgi:uroporphyrinogen decarboxylase|nr:uroporphyrinogen decarboxylase family protein [Candidatus Latescibacterota bacterium]
MAQIADRAPIVSDRIGGEMTPRERFRRAMHFQAVDRLPHVEFGYWTSLKDRWADEGHLPASLERDSEGVIHDGALERHFGCEQRVTVGGHIEAGPARSVEVVGERDGKVVYRDGFGILCEEVKEGIRTIPHYIEFPIQDRPSWERFRDEFLVKDDAWRGQTEAWIDGRAAELRNSTLPVGINFGSFIGRIRNWVGFENLAYMACDDPGLVEEMVIHLTELKLEYLPPLLHKIEFDYAAGWEDICFNSGPLLSPQMFRDLIIPHMRPVMEMLRQHGIDIIFTDTDGNIEVLVPLWLEMGMNCAFPFEIKPGNDVVRFRQEYGRDLLILGGFDKLVLFETKEAILAEFRRLEPVLQEGGFVPHIDHRSPDGVSFEIYQYYIREKCHFLGMGKEEIGRIPGLG